MAPPVETKKVLVGLSVRLEVLTKDKLRKFMFALTKTQDGAVDKWGIEFELLDRASTTAQFARALFLDVDIDLKKVAVEDVEATANKGLNRAQVDYVTGPLALTAERYRQGKVKEARLERATRDVFTARNA